MSILLSEIEELPVSDKPKKVPASTYGLSATMGLNQADSALNLAHLQLHPITENLCFFMGLVKIADVYWAWRNNFIASKSFSVRQQQEIQNALREVLRTKTVDGRVDWEKIWAQRGVSLPTLAMASSALERLTPGMREFGLGVLHLGKACWVLESQHITTVGGLIDAARIGIGTIPNFGTFAQRQVVTALKALSSSIATTGSVNWELYATNRGYPMIPKNGGDISDKGGMLGTLLAICNEAIPHQFDKQGWDVFQRRCLKTTRSTLINIAMSHGVCAERIRKIEESCLDAVRNPLLNDNYCGLEFRIRGDYVAAFRQSRLQLKTLSAPALRESRWLAELAGLWKSSEAEVRQYDRLIIECLNFRRYNLDGFQLEPIIMDRAISRSEAEKLCKQVYAVHEILTGNLLGLEASALLQALRQRGFDGISPKHLATLIDLCSTVETVKKHGVKYRLKLEFVAGRTNQAIRVLHEANIHLHHHQLIAEINGRLPECKRIRGKFSFVNQLCKDDRLQPIGKSGKWTLTEWKMETRPLIEVIDEVLMSEGKPLAFDEIARKVLTRRPGTEGSILLTLRMNPDRFQQASGGIYGLKSWGEIGSAITKPAAIGEFIEDYFKGQGGGAVNFRHLRKAFEEVSGLCPRAAACRLAAHPALEMHPATGSGTERRQLATYHANWQNRPAKNVGKPRRQPLQSERIVAEAKRLVQDEPSGECLLIDVVNILKEQMGICSTSIYAAIAGCREIEKTSRPGEKIKRLCLQRPEVPDAPVLDAKRGGATARWLDGSAGQREPKVTALVEAAFDPNFTTVRRDRELAKCQT